MDDWRKEFQYLLDRKILSRDELAYLFGQIDSIVERKSKHFQVALESIARNTCCDICQEAALVAEQALKEL